MVKKRKTAAEILASVDSFLGEFRKNAESATETITTEDLKTSEGISDSKKELGQEQSQAAKDSGATVETVSPNSEEAAEKPTDDMGVKKMTVDQPAETNSEVLTDIQKEDTGMATGGAADRMEQKMARAEKLGNGILEMLSKKLQPARKNDKEAAADAAVQEMMQKAAAFAQDAFESHLMGQVQRVIDEHEMSQPGAVNPTLLKQAGSVSALLDKLAEENPEAVLPEGLAPAPEEMAATEGLPAGLPEGLPAEAPAEAPVEEAPVGGGDVSEEEVNQLVDALDQAGVTPEELASAVEEVQTLVDAGIDPEELAQGIGELIQNPAAGAEGGVAEAAPEAEAPVEAPAEEAPAEEAAEEITEAETEEPKEAEASEKKLSKKQAFGKKAVEKKAQDERRQRVDAIKAMLKTKRS